MARYTHSARTTVGTINVPTWELRAGATYRLYVREIGVFLGAATASALGIGRPAAAGTATSPVTAVALDPADGASTGATAIAWSSAPTSPTIFLRRVGLPATIGAGVIWTFYDEPLVIPTSGNIVLWNITASAASVDVYVTFDE
jgi:hypothetical protein